MSLDRDERDLRPGDVFADRYEIERLLGAGGMGAVYRARDRSLGELIALKLLSLGGEPPETAALRFRQEVRLARRVTHPGVARVFDLGEHEGVLYLTMELVEGGTLRALMNAAGILPPERAARIAGALCDALQAAHSAGVLHRDIKPTNILLTHAGRVVIADFGIARSVHDAQQLTVGPIGTPSYMAPEQAFSGSVDERTDIYSVGILLYEMLTGGRPSGTADQILARLFGDDDGPSVPPALAALTLRCIAQRPEGRPSSAGEVARLLDRALTGQGDAVLEAPTVALPAAKPADAATVAGPAASTRSPDLRFSTEPGVGRALAVLPFRLRGARGHEDLPDALADELVDVLSRTRGLRVLGAGATGAFRDSRDARAMGRELAAFAVVDGTIQTSGDRVRITARLVDTSTGVQLWSETHEGDLTDAFDLQASIARRIAEELRIEITTFTHRGGASDDAMEHHTTARRRLRGVGYSTVAAAAAGFARCIELAPGFAPALAGHAIASMRSWFFQFNRSSSVDWETTARASVARALAEAPELAETHLAASMLAIHESRFQDAARSLTRALHIAPTYADAHEYLGTLQCEAGQAEEGVTRLRLANELDPTLAFALVFIARYHALRGELAPFEEALAELHRRKHVFSATWLCARAAAWRGDLATFRLAAADLVDRDDARLGIVGIYCRAFLGELDEAELDRALSVAISTVRNPRYLCLVTQLAAEVYGGRGDLERAAHYLHQAAAGTLVDIEWLDRCPLLAPLRERPEYAAARRLVRERIVAIWAP